MQQQQAVSESVAPTATTSSTRCVVIRTTTSMGYGFNQKIGYTRKYPWMKLQDVTIGILCDLDGLADKVMSQAAYHPNLHQAYESFAKILYYKWVHIDYEESL
ncbi:hypothetical protein BDA99DRAFT_532688 [Phascolomyces articulosus]|uniref:Uncharacterized protein n=1 Tax=Phascolomyces articulosus TaxID=60185 RepID=A0AAD5PJ32_9FUNG|nr:hypothetical protein BDA99DRAFT_532688 [Phascolomyces articulosus]